MKITNEFTVHTPIDRAWQALTDLPGIAPCLPGAQLTGVDGDVYRGKVKVKVGPVISDFAGTAQFTEKDDEKYRAVIDAKGRDSRAGGNAAALVTAALTPAGDSTLVTVDTDLKISGKLAQFGSGMIKEISNKLLAQFVANLEAKLAADQPTADQPTADQPTADQPAADQPAAAPARAGSTNGVAPAAPSPATEAPSAAAVDTVPGTAAVVAPGVPGQRPSAEAPSPETLTANLVPADPGAAEPAGLAVAGSEPLAASTTTPATTTPASTSSSTAAPGGSAGATTSPAVGAGTTSPAAAGTASQAVGGAEPEALDLLAVAGSSVYKRLIPLGVVVAVIIAVIAWLLGRR
ncbi:SRPBCC domain-containing protein [Paractinoplanes hotanensis]|uniref:SRPBCC domain-containing protein n=1 Tax=Paractinoplanes hotanensis TaxID=2906497 RepID=A0ABT0Y7X9_9ACTN|nr:SRPBCC domain-containing protein [Actinoplanes hotanensis]MCM4082136.1 SRPBCC domain-containing protein [Actinoplanes hotanensis]